MKHVHAVATLLLLALLLSASPMPVVAATPEPVEPCIHVATADSIRIYRCVDEETGFEFYANNLGFMFAEP